MLRRMIGATTLKAATYKEIKAGQGALWQAITVVLIVTLCGSIGGVLSELLEGASLLGLIWGATVGLVFGIVRWVLWTTVIYLLWALVLYLAGSRIQRTSETETSWAELGRVLGFAYTPGVLSIFAFVPSVGWLFGLVGFIWTLVAVIVAVRQSLDLDSTGRAVLVTSIAAIVGFIPWIIVLALGELIS